EPAGPVYLCYDAGLQEDELAAPVAIDDVVAAARPSPVQADPAALVAAADLIARAQRPVIVTEFTRRHPQSFAQLSGLAGELAAASRARARAPGHPRPRSPPQAARSDAPGGARALGA